MKELTDSRIALHNPRINSAVRIAWVVDKPCDVSSRASIDHPELEKKITTNYKWATYVIELENIIIRHADLRRLFESYPRLLVRNNLADVLDDEWSLRYEFFRLEAVPAPFRLELVEWWILALCESAILALVAIPAFRRALVLKLAICALFVARIVSFMTVADFSLREVRFDTLLYYLLQIIGKTRVNLKMTSKSFKDSNK